MNKTKVDWADYSWNPVTGCWGPGGTAKWPDRCWYCYAQKMAERFYADAHAVVQGPFAPAFHPDRLSGPAKVKRPSHIFVCSMGDLFGDWVPSEWIAEVQQVAHDTPWHTFIFLTKNPRRYAEFNPWPQNCWLGVTVTNQADADERIPELLKAEAKVRFVSVEPMLGPVDLTPLWILPFQRDGSSVLLGHPLLRRFQWVIIGALTGPNSRKHQPKPEWVQSLINQAKAAGVPVFLKDNLRWPEKIQERPEVD